MTYIVHPCGVHPIKAVIGCGVLKAYLFSIEKRLLKVVVHWMIEKSERLLKVVVHWMIEKSERLLKVVVHWMIEKSERLLKVVVHWMIEKSERVRLLPSPQYFAVRTHNFCFMM